MLRDQLIEKVSVLETQFTVTSANTQNEIKRKFKD
jgi:hypothetical protein